MKGKVSIRNRAPRIDQPAWLAEIEGQAGKERQLKKELLLDRELRRALRRATQNSRLED